MKFSKDGTISITKMELKALYKWASTDKGRPNLYGIGVHPKTCALVATNGHRLIAARDTAGSAGDGDPWLIPIESVKLALDFAKKHSSIVIDREKIVVDDHAVTLPAGGDATPPPPYEQVLPRRGKKGDGDDNSIGLNAAYLADLSVFVPISENVNNLLRCECTGSLEPALFYMDIDNTCWDAVIMTVRV